MRTEVEGTASTKTIVCGHRPERGCSTSLLREMKWHFLSCFFSVLMQRLRNHVVCYYFCCICIQECKYVQTHQPQRTEGNTVSVKNTQMKFGMFFVNPGEKGLLLFCFLSFSLSGFRPRSALQDCGETMCFCLYFYPSVCGRGWIFKGSSSESLKVWLSSLEKMRGSSAGSSRPQKDRSGFIPDSCVGSAYDSQMFFFFFTVWFSRLCVYFGAWRVWDRQKQTQRGKNECFWKERAGGFAGFGALITNQA